MKKENTGVDNSGNWNSGNRNSGNWNSGNRNSGNRNSGNGNSGNGNSGNRNSGNGNSGYGNSADRESGVFCSNESSVRMFNKPTDLKWDEIDHPHFIEFHLNTWVFDGDMTEQEKIDNKDFHVTQGYLKTIGYEEAWASFWKDTEEDNRQKFLSLPNFDSEVFEEITGIKVNEEQPSLSGKKVSIEVDGIKYSATID